MKSLGPREGLPNGRLKPDVLACPSRLLPMNHAVCVGRAKRERDSEAGARRRSDRAKRQKPETTSREEDSRKHKDESPILLRTLLEGFNGTVTLHLGKKLNSASNLTHSQRG